MSQSPHSSSTTDLCRHEIAQRATRARWSKIKKRPIPQVRSQSPTEESGCGGSCFRLRCHQQRRCTGKTPLIYDSQRMARSKWMLKNWSCAGAAILRRVNYALGCGPDVTATISVLGDRHEED